MAGVNPEAVGVWRNVFGGWWIAVMCRLGVATQLGPAGGAFVGTWMVGCQGCGLEQ